MQPNKVHREEAKSGDAVSILRYSEQMEVRHPRKFFSAESKIIHSLIKWFKAWTDQYKLAPWIFFSSKSAL